MGDKLRLYRERGQINAFVYRLINDIKALDKMLAAGAFETGIQRIGAEQELCLVDAAWRPAPIALEVLRELDDDHYTTEHSQYNLEVNLDPLVFGGDCLSTLERNLNEYLARLSTAAQRVGSEIALTGILPTIRRVDLSLENLTPLPRYKLMNEALNELRGGPYEFRIEGKDELITKHDSIMFEGCNTSFQIHLQVSPDEFANCFNWAHAIAGPTLAAAANSPILLGKRLWQESRIALFQQSVDTRGVSYDLVEKNSRITFGARWVRESITEVYKEDLARYRVLLGSDIERDSLEALEQGQLPALQALAIYNSTIYKWNRACFGVTDGKPHLRIENRILPAGPTVVDQVANAAFWFGLMQELPRRFGAIAEQMEFDDAKANFLKAARYGLEAQFMWPNGAMIPADELILQTLLPAAYDGLRSAGIVETDVTRYLTIIEERVASGQTGSRWILDSFEKLAKRTAKYEASVALTAAMVRNQKDGAPGHTWQPAEASDAGPWTNRYFKVEQIMSTDLFTVQGDDLVYFAANIMNWKRLRFIPVDDGRGGFEGLLTSRAVLDFLSDAPLTNTGYHNALVRDIMKREPLTVAPETPTMEALDLMRASKIGCLPVVEGGRLLGILTELNFMDLSEHAIESLRQNSDNGG